MLTVYKASAGSGKTYRLVAEYLKLLLQNEYNYKHILAVTFTNKATGEMKSRVLEHLSALARGHESAYIETLKADLNLTSEQVKLKSRRVIKNILHDYNRFSISTIDSFTQRVIKSFNRELGISPNFAVEINNDIILEEAVDNLLSKIEHDKKLSDWLVRYSEEKITDNNSRRIETNIMQLGRELFKEKFQVLFPDTHNSPYTRENIDCLRKDLNKIVTTFETTLRNKGKEAMAAIHGSGFTVNDFMYGTAGVAGFINNIAEARIKAPGVRVINALDSDDVWFTKNNSRKAELQLLVSTCLRPLLAAIVEYYNAEAVNYYSAKAVTGQLRMLGIVTDLNDEIQTLLRDKETLHLSDSNLLLSKIIGESDSPFIYEKVGNFYKYFMLDEFQDTSALQWNNFKPLIANSLAEGHKNLLVGDVKQSIYRWRNSDFNILAEQIDTDFAAGQITTESLYKNWRSDKNIVEFNNAAIASMKDLFATTLFNEPDDEWGKQKAKFLKVYDDIKQDAGKPHNDISGWVKVTFDDSEDFYESSLQMLVNNVKQLQDNGYKASDIAILIRKNSEGARVIEEFLSASKNEANKCYNLSVISNESLFLYASRAVLFVIAVIEWLIEPENKITLAALLQLWQSGIKAQLQSKGVLFNENNAEPYSLDKNFEYNVKTELGEALKQLKSKVLLTSLDETICEICNHFHLFKLENELPFIQTLIDKAGEIKISISNDLSNFLLWWSENKHKISVSINDNIDSIRLLTVHKSKGLEFKAVLIPFLNWKTTPVGNQLPVLWCHSEVAPYNRLPLLPVRAKSELVNTIFKKEYVEETASSYIDTLNLLYVAFTRAKSALVINTVNEERKGKNVNSMLKEALLEMTTQKPFETCWNEEKNIFEFGTLSKVPAEHEEANATQQGQGNLTLITDYSFNNFNSKLRLRLKSGDFTLHDGHRYKSKINIGNIKHEILSRINTAADLNKACMQALYEGIIDENELPAIQQELASNIQKPEVKHWFDGSWKVINERNLLAPDKLMRPDRIMISGKNAIVVDYKTGKQKSDSYNYQVRQYAQTLKATGLEKVEAFLWYLALNEVEKVGEF